ncbi:MAG: hypothetical protein AAF330_05505 [Pseudomonadota bacterium]
MDESTEKPILRPSMGVFDRPRRSRFTVIEVIALVLSLIWLLGSVVFFVGLGGNALAPEELDRLTFVVTLLAVFLPIALIWVAASAARSQQIAKEESQRLQAAVDALRQAYVADSHGRVSVQPMEKKLEEIASAARQTEAAVASFTSQRRPNRAPRISDRETAADGTDDTQTTLALGTPANEIAPTLTRDEYIRALHFPENTEDKEGFAALRLALKDRKASLVIRASQDMLTLLSQDGIYMDDLRPDRVRPELWRRFAEGERGNAISGVGGIHDRSSLALVSGRMRNDAVFRDTAHHFLRRFDDALVEFVEDASDAEIDAMSQTRTARSFMLMGRVLGIFG